MKATLSKILIYTLLSVLAIFLVWYKTPGVVENKLVSKVAAVETAAANEYFQDFENGEGSVNTDNPFAGKYSYKLGTGDFTPALSLKISDFPDRSALQKISLEAQVLRMQDDHTNFVFVVTISNHNGDNLLWDAIYTDSTDFKKGVWTKLNGELKLPEDQLFGDNTLKAFIWNQSGSSLLVDNLRLTVGKVYTKPGNNSFCDVLNKNCIRCNGDLLAPPYPTLYSKNTSSKSLLASVDIGEVISGNFDERSAGDEIANLKGESLSIFGQAGTGLKKIFSLAVSKEAKLVSRGKFQNTASDQLLIRQGKELLMISFDGGKPVIRKIEGSHDLVICGELNGDRREDILSIDRQSGAASLVDATNLSLIKLIVGTGIDTKSLFEGSGWNNWTGNGKQLAFITGKDVASAFQLISLNGLELKVTGKSNPIGNLLSKFGQSIKPGDKFFSIAGVAGVYQQAMDWRFDIKNIRFGDQPAIFGRIDFEGAINGNNPKFYEYQQVMPITLANGKSALLVVSSFVKPDASLPNKIEIYEIPK